MSFVRYDSCKIDSTIDLRNGMLRLRIILCSGTALGSNDSGTHVMNSS